MINLSTFFKVHFNNNKISDNNLKKFTEIHLQRLAAKNGGGQYTTMITDTTTAYTNYFGKMTNEDTKFAIQQGMTFTMNNVVKSFKETVSQKEGTIRGQWGVQSAEYQEFFPLGVTEYSNGILANMELLMTRFADAATLHQAQLGAPFVNTFTGLKTSFINARQAQLLKIGEVTDAKTETSQNRDLLEIQLMKNVLNLAIEYLGNEAEGLDFFDQSFIRDNAPEVPTPPTP